MEPEERELCNPWSGKCKWGETFMVVENTTYPNIICSIQTFVNGLLLRSGRVALRHGDSLRFGYGVYWYMYNQSVMCLYIYTVHGLLEATSSLDKGHLFRVKKVEPVPSNPPHSLPSPAPPPSPPHHPSISTSSTQTLPAHHNLTSPQVHWYIVNKADWILYTFNKSSI